MERIFCALLVSLLFFSCPYIPNDCEIVGDYEFVLPATLTPAKDTFQIGDTITIRSSFPDSVFEQKTGKWYLMENIIWFPKTLMFNLDSLGEFSTFLNFEVIGKPENNFRLFNYSDGSTSLLGKYEYVDHQYFLEFQMVALSKGLFFLSFGSSIYGHGNDQDFEGRCTNVAIDAIVQMNNAEDNNVDFLLESPEEGFHWVWEKKDQNFYDFGGYCFYVKE